MLRRLLETHQCAEVSLTQQTMSIFGIDWLLACGALVQEDAGDDEKFLKQAQ